MSEITADSSSDAIPSLTEKMPPRTDSHIRRVGGIIIPSKTWVPFMAGAVGGMSGAVLTAPLDVVKTRLQSDFYRDRLQEAKKAGTATSRIGVWRHLVETSVILRDVYRFEGLSALFKGLGPTLTGVVPARAINFYTYSNTKRLLEQNLPNAPLTGISFTAGVVAGIVTSTATNPIWVVKTRLQLDKSVTGELRYKNSLDCLAKIWRHEGIRGLGRGLSASYLGVSESTLQWVLFESLKRVQRAEKKAPVTYREKLREALGAGFFAKLIATVITYPHEVARTRLRQAPSLVGDQRQKYSGLIRVFITVWREEGITGLYGGLTPHVMRSVPAAMVYFTVYEGMLGWAGIAT